MSRDSRGTRNRRQRGEGDLNKIALAARELHAGDPHSQIEYIRTRARVDAAKGRSRQVSESRFNALFDGMHHFVRGLQCAGIHLRNLLEFSTKHVIVLVRQWEADRLMDSTVDQKLDILRRFTTLMGKPGVVPKGTMLKQLLTERGIAAGTAGRRYIPSFSKGWRDMGIDPLALIAAVAQDCEWVGMQLLMQCAWGLRKSESMQARVEQSDKGDFLFIYRGTKGGKPREVPYSTDPAVAKWQREVLDEAIRLAKRNPRGELAVPGLTLKQSKDRLRDVCRRHNICKAGLGITPHGLRHQFANDRFRELSGLPAPCLDLVPASEYETHREKVEWAFLQVSRMLGHERKSITAAYTGSASTMAREDRNRLVRTLDLLKSAGERIVEAGITEAWLVGTAGRGGRLAAGECVHMVVRLDAHEAVASIRESLDAVKHAAEAALGLAVQVTLFTAPGRPQDSAELLLPGARGMEPQAA